VAIPVPKPSDQKPTKMIVSASAHSPQSHFYYCETACTLATWFKIKAVLWDKGSSNNLEQLPLLSALAKGPPLNMWRFNGRECMGPRCIAEESSVPQGMFVCFDKRGWLVCRNSSDTEGCRESVRK
jgi:hypothetical protein